MEWKQASTFSGSIFWNSLFNSKLSEKFSNRNSFLNACHTLSRLLLLLLWLLSAWLDVDIMWLFYVFWNFDISESYYYLSVLFFLFCFSSLFLLCVLKNHYSYICCKIKWISSRSEFRTFNYLTIWNQKWNDNINSERASSSLLLLLF